MRGKICTKESCPICQSPFTLQIVRDTPGLYCSRGCRTAPHKFYVDGRGLSNNGKCVGKLYSDMSGDPLDSYGRALRLIEYLRAEWDRDKDAFDPTKYSNAGNRVYKVSECARAWQLHLESSGKKSTEYMVHTEMWFRVHINPCPIGDKTFGDLNVRKISPTDIEALQKHLQEKRKANGEPYGEITVKNILSVLMTMFHRLQKRGLKIGDYDVVLDRVPIFPEDWSKVDPKRKNWIDEPTQRHLLDRMDGSLKLWAQIFYETGARMGEVCAIQRADVLPDRTIYIQRAIDGRTGEPKPTKTMDQRTVSISEELYQKIASLPVVGEAYLFLGKKGKPYTTGNISTMLRDVYDAAGMPNLKPNASGRHSMATKKDIDAKKEGKRAASAQLGNTPAMAERAYIQDESTRIGAPNVVGMKEG